MKVRSRTGEIDAQIGARLKERRSLLSISQSKLASYLGITFQQVQKYERGTNRISAGRLYEISRMLNVNIDYFFSVKCDGYNNVVTQFCEDLEEYDDGDKSVDTNVNDGMPSRKEFSDLCRYYISIQDPSLRKSVMESVKNIARIVKRK